jgi:hypothetical protein
MLKRKYLVFFLELIFIFFIIMGGLKELERRKLLPVYDSDEVSWIFAGYYFNLYFLRFDFFNSDWSDYDAFDQPPLGKYIVGGALYLKGYTIDSLEPKRFLNKHVPLVNPQKYFDLVTPKVPNPKIVIPFTRSVIFGFALSALLLIYFSVRILYGVVPALISTLLIISNPIFHHVSTRILGDPILLFFFSLFVLLCVLYLKPKNNFYIVFAFIASSFAFLTKLNGIVLVFSLITVFLIKNKFSISKQDCKCLMIGFIAFLLISILLNPVFINTGIKAIGEMVEIRFSAFRQYQEAWKSLALLSVRERFVTATQVIFFKYSLFYQLIKIPVELIMFVAGFYYILRKKDLFLISIFAFLVVIPISILPFNLPRYFYWIFPFVYIIAGLSLCLFKEMLSRKVLVPLKSQDNILSRNP